jgi:hypothetical protein
MEPSAKPVKSELRCLELKSNSIGVRSMTETIWRCDQVRFGQLYNRMMFDTKAEAEQFVQRMRPMEPDQQFSIEAIEASKIWN